MALRSNTDSLGHPDIILPETGFVRLHHILKIYPGSCSSWWLGVREKRYPQFHKIGPNITIWVAEEIRELFGDAVEYTPFPHSGYVRLNQILEVIPVSKATWYAAVQNGRFPTPQKIGPNMAVYTAKAIHALIAEIRAVQQFPLTISE